MKSRWYRIPVHQHTRTGTQEPAQLHHALARLVAVDRQSDVEPHAVVLLSGVSLQDRRDSSSVCRSRVAEVATSGVRASAMLAQLEFTMRGWKHSRLECLPQNAGQSEGQE